MANGPQANLTLRKRKINLFATQSSTSLSICRQFACSGLSRNQGELSQSFTSYSSSDSILIPHPPTPLSTAKQLQTEGLEGQP